MVTVAELPRESEVRSMSPSRKDDWDAFSGLSVIELTEDISRQLNLSGQTSGVVVVGIKGGSPAAEAGLKRGDVIIEISRKKINGLDSYRIVSSEVRGEESVLMFVIRSGRKFYISLPAS